MKKFGFTLIEFMIVIVIMGIFAVVALPLFMGDCGNLDQIVMEYNVGDNSVIKFGNTPCVIKSFGIRDYRVMYKDSTGMYHVKTFSPDELLTKEEIYRNDENSWD